MRILFLLFASLLMCFMVGCGNDVDVDDVDDDTPEEKGGSPAGTSWDDLKPSERTQKIIKRALDDYGDNVKRSCKEWIYDVVYSASNGEVKVPLNKKSGDGWETDPDGYTFGGGDVILSHQNMNPALLNTTPGAIVQMQWKANVGSSKPDYNMHTAIVLSVFSDGVIFIESNYDSTPENTDDAVVSIRFESEKNFNEDVQAYSVYYIK